MNSELFRINLKDLAHGLLSAVIAAVAVAVLGTLQAVFSSPGFDVFSVDWATLGKTVLNTAIVAAQGAFSGYIGKKFLSDNSGKVLGKV